MMQIIPDFTPNGVMAYQASGLFFCALVFAVTQMPVPAALALSWCFIGLIYQYKLRRKARTESGNEPAAAPPTDPSPKERAT